MVKTLTQLIGKKNLATRQKKMQPTYHIQTKGGEELVLDKKDFESYKRDLISRNVKPGFRPKKISLRPELPMNKSAVWNIVHFLVLGIIVS